MTDTLEDIRPTIADILDGLPAGRVYNRYLGGETLRWCAEYEGARERPDLVAELERLEDILDRVDKALELPKAAELRAEIRAAVASW